MKEQNQAFIRGFQATLLEHIQCRLEIKVPDHNTRDAYNMDDVHSAVVHILESTATSAFNLIPLYNPILVQGGIKPEDLNSILNKFLQMIISALATRSYPVAYTLAIHDHIHDHQPGGLCHRCRKASHFIPKCPEIEKAITTGKCQRNHEGKVILSTGVFVP